MTKTPFLHHSHTHTSIKWQKIYNKNLPEHKTPYINNILIMGILRGNGSHYLLGVYSGVMGPITHQGYTQDLWVPLPIRGILRGNWSHYPGYTPVIIPLYVEVYNNPKHMTPQITPLFVEVQNSPKHITPPTIPLFVKVQNSPKQMAPPIIPLFVEVKKPLLFRRFRRHTSQC